MVFFSLDDIGVKAVFLSTVTGGLKHWSFYSCFQKTCIQKSTITKLNWQCPNSSVWAELSFTALSVKTGQLQIQLIKIALQNWNQRVHACHETPKISCDKPLIDFNFLRSKDNQQHNICWRSRQSSRVVFHRRSRSYSLHNWKLSRGDMAWKYILVAGLRTTCLCQKFEN